MAKLVESHDVAPMESLSGKSWKVKIIQAGRGSSANYPADVLEAQADIVKPRTKVFLNHPSLDEQETRPERDARDVIGYFKESSSYKDGALFGEVEIFSDVQEWVKERALAGVIGMSIRGSGDLDESGNLTRFDKIESVDLVTTPGAGGGFEQILEARRNKETSEKETEGVKMDKELAEALDVLNNGLTEKIDKLADALNPVVEALNKAKDEAEKVKESKKLSAADLAAKLVEAEELPKGAHARVLAAYEGGTDLDEAIKAEVDYAKSLTEAAGKESFSADLEEAEKSDFEFRSIFTS